MFFAELEFLSSFDLDIYHQSYPKNKGAKMRPKCGENASKTHLICTNFSALKA
jgi:hypothetical protein